MVAYGGNTATLTVSCASNQKVLGGGGSANYYGMTLSSSYPNGSSSWTVIYRNNSAYTQTVSMDAYAICAKCQ